jgi:hypothetical protein
MNAQAKVSSVARVEWAAIHGMSDVKIVFMADPISIPIPIARILSYPRPAGCDGDHNSAFFRDEQVSYCTISVFCGLQRLAFGTAVALYP